VKKKTMIDQDRATILMVDDQPGKLMSYEAILDPLGENLIKARSAREALDHLLHHDIAVVLMDVSMPEIDGFELADMIRQHPRFQKIAIIFISAVHLTDVDRIKGYQSGAVDYISVPVVPELLRAKVSVFSELHRKTWQLERLNLELEKRVEERTEQLRKSEEQLQERVAELEAIMQVLPVGVAVSQDREGHRITANVALTNLLGMKPGENLSADMHARGNASFEIFEDGNRLADEDHPLLRSAKTGQQLGSLELEIRRPEKDSIHLLASASPLFDHEGNTRGAVGAFIDVTSRKQLEDLLRERADLLELASEAIIVRDVTGAIQYWNSGAEALYGWRREQVLGKSIDLLLHTKFPTEPSNLDMTLSQTGTWEGNLIHLTREGAKVTVASRQALKAEGNAILQIDRDITVQLKTEDALRKTERLAAMGRVAGIIAHEINNPLEAITNTFYLLRDHPSLNEEARYYAKLGEQELMRVAHITRQTLGFYRESLHPVKVSISTLLDELLELQTRRVEFDKIVLDKRYHTSGAIHGFPVELKQVFLNLIGNAVQAMPNGGTLRLHVFRSWHRPTDRSGVCISICDTGTGIDPEHAKHLFEPFFTTKATKGTGLGLWISKGIIQKYGGSIRFRSVLLEERNITCFQIFLPDADFENVELPGITHAEHIQDPSIAGVPNDF
jgi:PAS domain S-box-containing protein